MTALAMLMTMAEVSDLTGIPVNTLRYYRHLGNKGPRSAVLGSRVMYLRKDVMAWIEEQFEKEAAK